MNTTEDERLFLSPRCNIYILTKSFIAAVVTYKQEDMHSRALVAYKQQPRWPR
jgi:hypothetical protein